MKRNGILGTLLLAVVAAVSLVGCGEPPHTHSFGEWTVLQAATCTEDGTQTRACSCGERQTRSVQKTGHALSAVYRGDATFDTDGTVVVTCQSCDYTETRTAEGSAAFLKHAFADKTVSVLGDSISTYLDVSNGAAADTSNTTIRDGVLYYDAQKIRDLGVELNSTWWQRTVNTVGASLLVNNSWSGSYVKDASTNAVSTPGAYLGRAQQLHDDTGDNAGQTPDMVFVFMGTNDYYKYKANVGEINASAVSALRTQVGDASYRATTVAEAYAMMLLRIRQAYPTAEIYCLNVLESSISEAASLAAFNGMIEDACSLVGATYVDICEQSGIRAGESYEVYVPSDDGDGTPNSLHPNALGMERIAEVVVSAVLKNSVYLPAAEDFTDASVLD